jgi:hypothetical protein
LAFNIRDRGESGVKPPHSKEASCYVDILTFFGLLFDA